MTCLFKGIRIIIFLILAVIAILYSPFSNNVAFTKYDISPSTFDYPKGENLLNNAERLFEGIIRGPECFSTYKDELYMSAHGGWIYKLNGDEIVKVVKTGQDCDERWWQEASCGRPLGITFDSLGNLYIADAYNGIFMTNLSTGVFDGTLKQLVPLDVAIHGKFPHLPNSLDISKDDVVYWTDSSSEDNLNDGFMILLADGNGRLLKTDKRNGQHIVLMDHLSFANGVALSKDDSFVVVAETGRSRVHKYHLKGPKAGKSEIFLDNLPGFPDNIHLDEDGYIVISLMNPFENDKNILALLKDFPNVRKFLYKSIRLIDSIFIYLDNIFPHYIFTYLQNWIGHLESIELFTGKTVKVLFVSEKGEVKKVFNAVDGKVSHISDFIKYKGYFYLGSPYNNYLGRVKTRTAN